MLIFSVNSENLPEIDEKTISFKNRLKLAYFAIVKNNASDTEGPCHVTEQCHLYSLVFKSKQIITILEYLL